MSCVPAAVAKDMASDVVIGGRDLVVRAEDGDGDRLVHGWRDGEV